MKTAHITKIVSESTGGGNTIDFVYLPNGQILGIDNECVCLYEDMNEFYDGKDGNFDHIPMITLRVNEQ